jgi:DUF1009 family protein
MSPTSGQHEPMRIGLLAAWGDFPLIVARQLKAEGHQVIGLGVRHHCDPQLADICDEFGWVGLARLGGALRFFHRHRVTEATMAGKIHKVLLYQPWTWLRHTPDWTAIKTFAPHFISNSRDRKDDTLLGTIVELFARNGIRFVPATDFAPQLLVPPGHIAGPRLTPAQQTDVDFGWDVAKQMGALDIGQSVCVKGQTILAVEAIEGTDLCITRAGELCRQGGFSVVKVAKPQQDMRFDVPTVGLGTLRNMVAAGGKVLAIEGGKTIVLEEAAFCEFAQRHGLSIVSLDPVAQAQNPLRNAG